MVLLNVTVDVCLSISIELIFGSTNQARNDTIGRRSPLRTGGCLIVESVGIDRICTFRYSPMQRSGIVADIVGIERYDGRRRDVRLMNFDIIEM